MTVVLNSDKMLETFGQLFVCRVQSGNYTQAAELAEKAMALERDDLGSRPERMSELYFLLAYVQDEVVLQRRLINTLIPNWNFFFLYNNRNVHLTYINIIQRRATQKQEVCQ